MCESGPRESQDLSLQRILEDVIDEVPVSFAERKVLRQLIACGTGELGHHYLVCKHCSAMNVVGRACKNRHCPNCNASRTAEWCAKREEELLPVPYQRYEFGLPSALHRLARQYKREMYGLLLKAAQDTVLELAKAPESLGVAPAVLTTLHTATRTLGYFPHAHVEASAGGYDAEQDQWLATREGALIAPLDQAHDLFRDKVLDTLDRWRRHGRFSDGDRPEIELLSDDHWTLWMAELRGKRWPVTGGEPFGGGIQYLRYLSRSVYRLPISNRRLLSYRDGEVVFQYRDRETLQSKTRRMNATSFVQLLAMHILPPGLHQVRFSGLWASPSRAKLAKAQEAARLAVGSFLQEPPTLTRWIAPQHRCERCHRGEMQLLFSTMPWGAVLGPAARAQDEARGPPVVEILTATTRPA